MRKLIAAATLAAALVTVPLAMGHGAKPPTKLKAALNIGQEKPVPKGTKLGAAGSFTATVSGTTITWTLTYKNLSGPAMAAHIHTGARGVNGGVLIGLCGTSTTPACTSGMHGTATATADQLKSIMAGKTYVNVHTTKNPNGEIRGQITKALA